MVPGSRKVLLPPGGIRGKGSVNPPDVGHRIIYVGAAGPHDGVEMLVAAFELVRATIADADLWLVMRPNEVRHHIVTTVGVHVLEASGEYLESLLQSAQVLVPASHPQPVPHRPPARPRQYHQAPVPTLI